MIRGATVMRGYWEKPEATAKKLKPGPLPGELVLHTGLLTIKQPWGGDLGAMVRFEHRTLQEFLAACRFARHGVDRVLDGDQRSEAAALADDRPII